MRLRREGATRSVQSGPYRDSEKRLREIGNERQVKQNEECWGSRWVSKWERR